MITRTSWKFLPLAAFLALGALVFATDGHSPLTVNAAVSTVVAEDASLNSGGETTVTVTLTASTNNVTISAAGDGDGTGLLTVEECTPSCTAEEGESGDSVSISTNNVTEIVLTLVVTCTEDDVITITATQTGGSAVTEEVTCAGANITIIKTASGAGTTEFNFSSDGTSIECDPDFTLVHQGSKGMICDEPGTYTIIESATTGWNLSTIVCDDNGEADSVVTVSDRKVVITLTADADDDDSVVCTFTNIGGTPTVGAASTVTASASPNSVGCNASSFVTLTIKDAAGAAVANGTSVTVSVSGGGSVNPTTTTTTGGGALILYTAPSTGSGTATITATAGTAVGSTTVQFACAAAQVTTAPPPPPAPAQIAPPSTGDAGLADQASLPAAMALALVVSVLVGALAAKRVRA